MRKQTVKNILPFRDSPVLLIPWCFSLYIFVYAHGIKNSFTILEPCPPAPQKPHTTLLKRSGQLFYRMFHLLAYLVASSLFWYQLVSCNSVQFWYCLPGGSVDHTGSRTESSTRPSHFRLQPQVLEAHPRLGPISCKFRGSHKFLRYSDCLIEFSGSSLVTVQVTVLLLKILLRNSQMKETHRARFEESEHRHTFGGRVCHLHHTSCCPPAPPPSPSVGDGNFSSPVWAWSFSPGHFLW